MVMIKAARGEVRRRVWSLAGEHAPTAGISAASPLVIDVDATLVEVHSAKEGAAPTFKGGFGYHPLTAWLSLSMFLCKRVRSEMGVDSVGVGGGEPGGPAGGALRLVVTCPSTSLPLALREWAGVFFSLARSAARRSSMLQTRRPQQFGPPPRRRR